MFVAQQGAGLAKLRWVLKVHGYVLTSAVNLRLSKAVFLDGRKVGAEDSALLLSKRQDGVENILPSGPDGRRLLRFEGETGLSSVNFQIVNPARILRENEELFRSSLNRAEASGSPSDNLHEGIRAGREGRKSRRSADHAVSLTVAVTLADPMSQTGSAEPARQARPPVGGKLAAYLTALLE